MKKEEKNPFVGFTLEAVVAAEASAYTIQVGDDFFLYKGKFAFSKRQTIGLYNKIRDTLVDTINNGTLKQRKEAQKHIVRFHISPLRIQ